MAYIERELAEGEKLIRLSRPSWWTVNWLTLLALAVLVVAGVVMTMLGVFTAVVFWAMVAPIVAVIWLVMIIGPMIKILSTEIAITDRRVTSKTGVFTITVKTTPLDKVNNCDVTQTIMGRMLGYGDLEVTTATAEEADNHRVRRLAHPNDFRNELTSLVDAQE